MRKRHFYTYIVEDVEVQQLNFRGLIFVNIIDNRYRISSFEHIHDYDVWKSNENKELTSLR